MCIINRKLFYKGFIISLALFNIINLTACELEKKETDDNENIMVSDITMIEEEHSPYPVTIAGVEIIKSPESIICLSPSLTEIICELGFSDKLKGRSSYCNFPLAVTELIDMGSSANPDINKILSLSPDVVLTQTPIADKDLFIMEQAGIVTLLLPSPKSLDDFRGIYRSLGLLFNGAFTGIEYGDEAFSPISKLCNNSDVLNIGSFIYITEGLSVATGNTFESSIFSCFGNNIAVTGTRYDFDKEILLENQPDIILLSDKYSLSDLMNDEIFFQLDAVTNERIILINNIFFERPSERMIEMLEKFIIDYKMLS